MAHISNNMSITNETGQPRVVWIEPWGGDFTLLPGDTFEIVATDLATRPCFSIVEQEDGTQIYVEVPDPTHCEYEVLHGGTRLPVGYHRQ